MCSSNLYTKRISQTRIPHIIKPPRPSQRLNKEHCQKYKTTVSIHTSNHNAKELLQLECIQMAKPVSFVNTSQHGCLLAMHNQRIKSMRRTCRRTTCTCYLYLYLYLLLTSSTMAHIEYAHHTRVHKILCICEKTPAESARKSCKRSSRTAAINHLCKPLRVTLSVSPNDHTCAQELCAQHKERSPCI